MSTQMIKFGTLLLEPLISVRRPRRVLILGCGPAGLFAAQAADSLGWGVDVFSRKRRSEMFGAQYLHTSIPGLTDDQIEGRVEYILEGELDDYLHKVYGPVIPDPGKITKEGLVGIYPAWDIRRAYFAAWAKFSGDISPGVVDLKKIRQVLDLGASQPRYSALISTVPLDALCNRNSHTFETRTVWAVGDAPERGQFAPQFAQTNTIIYSAEAQTSWYRASNINGYNALEFPEKAIKIARMNGASRVDKPVWSDCDCVSKMDGVQGLRVLQVGRYGAWHRTGHTHQAYWRALEMLRGIDNA
jgi:hypothetical protein